MRRDALKLGLLAATAAASGLAFAAKGRHVDSRLLGTWLSDKERTVQLWRYRKPISDEHRLKFEAMFGLLRRRFTATHLHTEYEGHRNVMLYKVVAADSRSVVLSFPEEKGADLQQVFFEDDGWSYIVAGYNVEFFRRVEDEVPG